jgi:hypothetical protein
MGDMTPSAVRRLALGVSAKLQGLARLFEQLETGFVTSGVAA